MVDLLVSHGLSDSDSLFSLSEGVRGGAQKFGVGVLSGHLEISGIVDETLLDLSFLLGEQDQFGDVGLQSSLIQIQRFLALVSSSMIDRDTHGAGEGNSESGGLDFFQSKALNSRNYSALFDLAVVSHSGATDDGSEGFSRSREQLGGFSFSSVKSSLFTSRLVEPGSHKTLPVFSEVNIGNDIIMFHGKDI